MAELDNSKMFELAWDARFEWMILDQLDEEKDLINNTRTDMPCTSGVVYYPFKSATIVTCLYCKSQHNTLYLNKHSHNQCAQCGAPLNLN